MNAPRLEQALRNAEFEPDTQNIWRWKASAGPQAVIKFELLADIDTERAQAIIKFDGCKDLGAVNLRGTGHATSDIEVRTLTAMDQGVRRSAEMNVAGLAGFLVAKVAAAYSRRKPKDWYDIAYVLLHDDYGDARAAATRVQEVFGSVVNSLTSTLVDLKQILTGLTLKGQGAALGEITGSGKNVI